MFNPTHRVPLALEQDQVPEVMAVSLASTGDFAQSRAHFDKAIGLYDPAAHRPLATRFGHRVAIQCDFAGDAMVSTTQ